MTQTVRHGRVTTLEAHLSRLGVDDVARVSGLLTDSGLVDLVGPVDADTPWLSALSLAADPALAVLGVVRIADAVQRCGEQERELLTAILGGIEGGAAVPPDPSVPLARLICVLGASTALADDLVRRPADLLAVIADPTPGTGVDARAVRAELLTAVGADPDADVPVAQWGGGPGVDRMRRAYRTRLLRIAASDLTSPEPLTLLPAVAAALADLASAALEAALAIARADVPGHEIVRLAVIGMGKTGGRELNYVSDVDVVYVAEPAGDAPVDEALAVGARLVAVLQRACGGPSGEPALWAVDAALRPEGKQGPIVRTLDSHITYYKRWAKTWEFQALLKARPVAGDRDLGAGYVAALNPMVWQAVCRDGFVEDSQAMRRRVEDHVPAAERDRQIKLGKGGLRDVEFTVQLLQLVHGRADETLHSGNTLTALAALAAGGYVSRTDAASFAVCYRFLRVLEHRVQLYRMRRTHLLPTSEGDLRRLARACGMRSEGAEGLMNRWRATRREVRSLHEDLFYRPLLPATAQLSNEDVSLAPEAARTRLAAIGYRDPEGALRHIAALTHGVSRRAAIQRQLLPVMLGWFAEGADPDRGLLSFRKLSEELGGAQWYLKLLRDSGTAAYRLASLLSTSQMVTDALARTPEMVRWLAQDDELIPLDAQRLRGEMEALVSRSTDGQAAALAVRAVRRRELARAAAGQLLGVTTLQQAQQAISDVTDVCLEVMLAAAQRVVSRHMGHDPEEPAARMLIVAMGRLGGHEMGYGSDADVMFVHQPAAGVSEPDASTYALGVATAVRQLLGETAAEPPLEVDPDLRPEGRNGPLVRSLDSYREYYSRWSAGWESQALLRARPVAGDPDLAARFTELIDPLRYPAEGLTVAQVRDVRRIKARVESERLPRGVEPARHLKLGPGGIADVEWTVQLLQLQHGAQHPALRTTQTLRALAAARDAGLIDPDDAERLAHAWQLASGVRAAWALWSGKTRGPNADVLPHAQRDLRGIARAMRFSGTGSQLEETYLRAARRCRAVVRRVFYGESGGPAVHT